MIFIDDIDKIIILLKNLFNYKNIISTNSNTHVRASRIVLKISGELTDIVSKEMYFLLIKSL